MKKKKLTLVFCILLIFIVISSCSETQNIVNIDSSFEGGLDKILYTVENTKDTYLIDTNKDEIVKKFQFKNKKILSKPHYPIDFDFIGNGIYVARFMNRAGLLLIDSEKGTFKHILKNDLLAFIFPYGKEKFFCTGGKFTSEGGKHAFYTVDSKTGKIINQIPLNSRFVDSLNDKIFVWDYDILDHDSTAVKINSNTFEIEKLIIEKKSEKTTDENEDLIETKSWFQPVITDSDLYVFDITIVSKPFVQGSSPRKLYLYKYNDKYEKISEQEIVFKDIPKIIFLHVRAKDKTNNNIIFLQVQGKKQAIYYVRYNLETLSVEDSVLMPSDYLRFLGYSNDKIYTYGHYYGSVYVYNAKNLNEKPKIISYDDFYDDYTVLEEVD